MEESVIEEIERNNNSQGFLKILWNSLFNKARLP